MQNPSSPPVLELQNVAIRYGGNLVVSGASFHVDEGEFITLLGPSGSGKTSLLRTIAGFVAASSGRVLLRGEPVENVPPYERDVGMVFQNYALFPHMTIRRNLSFGPRMMKVAADEVDSRIAQALAQVRLGPYADRYPHELSGGQQQRVAIARALAMRPSLLLLDEPMSNLDARLRAEMRVELVELLKRLGMTAVAVTHNQEEALAMSDRIVVMSEGAIRQVGTPAEIYARPADDFVANFVGDANVIDAGHAGFTPSGHSIFRTESGQSIRVAGDPELCRAARRLLIRPESIRLAKDLSHEPAEHTNRMTALVRSTAYMGSYTEVRTAFGTREILVKVPASGLDAALVAGGEVVIEWNASDVRAIAP